MLGKTVMAAARILIAMLAIDLVAGRGVGAVGDYFTTATTTDATYDYDYNGHYYSSNGNWMMVAMEVKGG